MTERVTVVALNSSRTFYWQDRKFRITFESFAEPLPRMLENGEFDRALDRPRNVIFQVMASRVHFVRIGATLLLYLLEMERSVFYMLMPLLGLVFLIPGYVFFRFGLRHYKSTGS